MSFYFSRKLHNENFQYFIEKDNSNILYDIIFSLRSPCEYDVIEVFNEIDNLNNFSENIIEASDRLYGLIYSAKQYPPAISFTRINIMHYCKKLNKFSIDQIEYLAILLLDEYLENQKKFPFFMARCKSEYLRFLVPNSYYWIVGYDKETNQISWVSEDYFIYEDDLD
ncbi:MAG: hypothetical protein U0354_12410 [Candidatus Sericytochromatia bacterium]